MSRSNITLREWCIKTNNLHLLSYLDNISDADKYSYASHTKLAWVCNNGHKCYSAPFKFTTKGTAKRALGVYSCQVCQGKQIIIGYNDLATTRPDLAEEWNYERNTILPTQVTAGSFKDVWWKCKLGHEWVARVSARDYRNGCPYCNSHSKTSIPEQILFYYCRKHFQDSINMYSLDGVSYDIYIPSKGILIEYDGSAWHENKDTSYKFNYAMSKGLKLYKISGVVTDEPNTFIFNDTSLNITNRDNALVHILYTFLSSVFGINETFNDYDKAYIFAKNQKIKSKSEGISLPDGVEFEWSPLNGYDYSYATNDSYNKYWRCFNGHTFKRRIDVIKRGHTDCPFCQNKQSFDFKYLGMLNNLYIILDVNTCEIEFLDVSDMIKALGKGYNIQGVVLNNSGLNYSLDYIYNMKPTAFRLNFERFKGVSFKCLDYRYKNYVDGLSNIFSNGSVEIIHNRLNKFLK